MPVETSAVYISDLNAAWPIGASDTVADLDDSIQVVKSCLQNTLPNLTGAMTATHTELSLLAGAAFTAAELGYLAGATAGVVLTTGDEGSGNGIDADTLDGQEGAYYQDASNLNAGTIPAARIPTATESAVGGGEIATQAETKTGTSDALLVTPAKLRGLGGQVLLETSSPAAAAQVDFDTVFEDYTDFKYFIVRGHLYFSSNGSNLSLRATTDSGSTYLSSAIYYHSIRGSTMAASPTNLDLTNQSQTQCRLITSAASSAGLYNNQFEIRITNPQDTTSIKWLAGDAVYEYSTPIPAEITFKGAVSTVTAVDGIRLLPSAGTVTGEVQVYGII